jgi:hypothetical protein
VLIQTNKKAAARAAFQQRLCTDHPRYGAPCPIRQERQPGQANERNAFMQRRS